MYFDYKERGDNVNILPISQTKKESKTSEILNENNIIFKNPLNNTLYLKNLDDILNKLDLNLNCNNIFLRYEFQGVLN